MVAAIVPWKYPTDIAVSKVAPALAAGNTVILKPASITPLTALLLAEVFDAAGAPPGSPAGAHGSRRRGRRHARRLAAVDMVTLTGSVEVGREVGRLAADTVKKCVLELGGKSANVVFADCTFEAAIQGQMLAMFTTAGQVCTAGTRLIVERSLHDEFVAALAKRAGELVIGPAIDPATEWAPGLGPAAGDRGALRRQGPRGGRSPGLRRPAHRQARRLLRAHSSPASLPT